MKVAIIAGSIILPVVMFYSASRWHRLQTIFGTAGILALLIFGNIAALKIYQIIKDGTVFMTAVHAIFLNPYFLVTAGYLGIFSLYLLLLFSRKTL